MLWVQLSNKINASPQSSSKLPWIINAVECPKCRQQLQLQLDIGITLKPLMGIIVCHTGKAFWPFQPRGKSPQQPQHSAFGAAGFRDVHKYEAPHFRSKWSQILKLLPEKIPFVLTNVDTEESFMSMEL